MIRVGSVLGPITKLLGREAHLSKLEEGKKEGPW